jgi:hypothetical protein
MEVGKMHMPAFPALQSRYRSFTSRRPNQASSDGFFQNHPITNVARSVFFSSLLWMVLAIALYGVYSIVVGTV